jgi:RNA polymerase sigma-70 factor (ECF subfamily)
MAHGAAMSEHGVDARVITACQQGDREAFRLLYEAYKDQVYSIALHFLGGDAAAAEDIAQDVFLRLFTRIGQFRRDADFSTWLYRLVANACVDEHRRRRRFVPCEDTVEGSAPDPPPEEHCLRFELVDAVRAALAELSPKLRVIVLLKYFEDLSYEEMARALGCSKGTVASRLNRSHKALARKLAHLRDTLLPGEEPCSTDM